MATRTIRGHDLGRAIADSLRLYTQEVSDAIREEVDQTAKDIERGIEAKSPKGATGKYAKGWKITKRDTKSVTSRIVHNAKLPGLPHLLEHGHAKRGGGRVEGIPHIAPVAQPRLQQMHENIKRIIRDGG